MPRKTINVCGHCNERKATDACVICDKDLCDRHTTGSIRDAYLVNRSAQYRHDHRPDMVLALGPFCPDCVDRHHYAIEDPHRDFARRFRAAAENVGNLIARELFGDHEEGDREEIVFEKPGYFYLWSTISSDEWSRKTPEKDVGG